MPGPGRIRCSHGPPRPAPVPAPPAAQAATAGTATATVRPAAGTAAAAAGGAGNTGARRCAHAQGHARRGAVDPIFPFAGQSLHLPGCRDPRHLPDWPARGAGDRKSVVLGKSVTVRVDLGGRRLMKKKRKIIPLNMTTIIRLKNQSLNYVN